MSIREVSMSQRYDLTMLRENSEGIADYLSSVSCEAPAFARRKGEYSLNENLADELKRHSGEAVIIVFSAEWCPDCHRNVPVFGLLSEATGLDVRVFGHLKRDVKNPEKRWRIPPSPAEVREFNVVKIPLIVVLNRKGEKIGEIVENPPEGKSLEETLLDILKKD